MKSVISVFAACLLAGCASSTPLYDAHFGEAVRRARMEMALNPSPPTAPVPVGSLEGKAVRDANLRYQESFRSPPPVVNVINIGGAVTGQTQ